MQYSTACVFLVMGAYRKVATLLNGQDELSREEPARIFMYSSQRVGKAATRFESLSSNHLSWT